MREFLPLSTTAPYVEGNRFLRHRRRVPAPCPDICGGFRDGENSGPYQEEVFRDTAPADTSGSSTVPCLGVFAHEASNSDVLPVAIR